MEVFLVAVGKRVRAPQLAYPQNCAFSLYAFNQSWQVWELRKGYTSGGVKRGRFVILRFPLFYSIWGPHDTEMLGKTTRNVPLSHPFLCAPSPTKNQDLRAVSPNPSRQRTGKMTNRRHFAHTQGTLPNPKWM